MSTTTSVYSILLLFFIAPILSSYAGEPYYDYMQLGFQNPRYLNPWTTSTTFTAYGLWPQNISNVQDPIDIVDCPLPGGTFDSSKLFTELQNHLDKSWPNLESRKRNRFGVIPSVREHNQQLWNYEYKKHGSCTSRNMPQEEQYFKMVDIYYNDINITELLTQDNIAPGSSKPVADFENAIAKGIDDFRPRLLCNGNIITHVLICLDQRGVHYMDCEKKSKGCNPTIYY